MLMVINKKLRLTSPGAPPTGRLARRSLGTALLMMCLTSSGCCLPQILRSTFQPYENILRMKAIKLRAASQASDVWEARFARCYAHHACSEDVRDGFITGYVEAAFGSDGCPPPVPRSSTIYRTIGHRTPAAIPWYEGYDLGHAAAITSGVDRWRLLPTDPDLLRPKCESSCCSESQAPLALEPDYVPAEPVPAQLQSEPTEVPAPMPELPPGEELNLPEPDGTNFDAPELDSAEMDIPKAWLEMDPTAMDASTNDPPPSWLDPRNDSIGIDS